MAYSRKEVHDTRGRSDFEWSWRDTFTSRVPIAAADDCWNWTGTLNKGRAVFAVGTGKAHRKISASRYAYWLAHDGGLPDELVVCHRCDNPGCVNPAHLFLGSQADNLADMTVKGRRSATGLGGEQHPNAKLTDEKAREIARRLGAGESASALAREFRLSRSAIYRAASRGAR